MHNSTQQKTCLYMGRLRNRLSGSAVLLHRIIKGDELSDSSNAFSPTANVLVYSDTNDSVHVIVWHGTNIADYIIPKEVAKGVINLGEKLETNAPERTSKILKLLGNHLRDAGYYYK